MFGSHPSLRQRGGVLILEKYHLVFCTKTARYHLNLRGRKFGRWTVLQYSHTDTRGNRCWKVICECGKNKVIAGAILKSGITKSCGCYRDDKVSKATTTHGMSTSREYSSWHNMKKRCLNKRHPSYARYGGRGIKICKRWVNSFELFFEDMGIKPKYMTLERVDNSRGYYKANCRWATRKEQAMNRDNSKL